MFCIITGKFSFLFSIGKKRTFLFLCVHFHQFGSLNTNTRTKTLFLYKQRRAKHHESTFKDRQQSNAAIHFVRTVYMLAFTPVQSPRVTRHRHILPTLSSPVFQCDVGAHSNRQDLRSLAVRESYRWESNVVFYPLWYAAYTPCPSVHARCSV